MTKGNSLERILVTSYLNKENISKKYKIALLGEWCIPNNTKHSIKEYDYIILNYHWNNRKKLYKDYHFLSDIYEEFLTILSKELNTIHKKNNSREYWRILIGPWLAFFIQTIFDRWEMINSALNDYKIKKMFSSTITNYIKFVPSDFVEFDELVHNKSWNEFIYSFIGNKLQFEKVKITDFLDKSFIRKQTNNSKYQNFFKIFINIISKFFFRKGNILIVSNCLPAHIIMRVSLSLNQLPTFWYRIDPKKTFPDINQRKWQINYDKKGLDKNYDFKKLLSEIIPLQIPSIYLEGYESLIKKAKIYYPNKASLIFDTTSWNSDDLFKHWMGLQKEKKSKIIITQHGGNYGSSLFNFTEEHQLSISDKFISWGWKNNKSNKILNIGNTKSFRYKKIKPKKNSQKFLIVEGLLPKYSTNLYSTPVSACQWNEYFNDQFNFVKHFPKDFIKNFDIRLAVHDYGYDQKNLWRSKFPQINFANPKVPFISSLKNYSLVVATYNATTYLETLSINFPTIIFWNTKYWELRSSAISDYQLLYEVGIIHETTYSAANHIKKIKGNINSWWQSARVQNAKNIFVEKYCKPIKHSVFIENIKQLKDKP